MATAPQPPSSEAPPPKRERERVHAVVFVTYPKLLFVWPVILAGFLFYFFGYEATVTEASRVVVAPPAAPSPTTADTATTRHAPPRPFDPSVGGAAPPRSTRLERLGWAYVWILVLVLLTLGLDVDRNMAIFWIVLFVAVYVLGLWLHDVKGFTLFGDIYRWFARLDLQYNRNFGLAASLVLLVPYVLMIGWGHVNDRWRITHNEFEHYSLGKMDDSLGRGAKTVRTSYPDVFELLLGLAGTMVVYNASGTKELRRIPHVMFLPFIRARLGKILESTAITMATVEEEEEEEETQT